MPGNCEKCLKGITSSRFPGISCGLCLSVYHIKCAEISDEVLSEIKNGSATWHCPDCRTVSNSSIIKGPDDGIDILTETPIPNIGDLMAILKGMQRQLDSLKNSMNFVCKSTDDLKVAISVLTNDAQRSDQRLKFLERKSEEQQVKINTIEAQLDRPLQEQNQSNIVVCGIPPNYNDISSLVINIGNVIGVQILEDDIISVNQMVHRKQTDSVLKNSFIIKLKTVELKNLILSSFRKKKTLHFHELAADFSMALKNQKIFILHHFTKFQSTLYNAAKTIKREHNFHFLWYKNNNIFLRQTAESRIYQISSLNDINRLNIIHPFDVSTGGTSAESSSSHAAVLDSVASTN